MIREQPKELPIMAENQTLTDYAEALSDWYVRHQPIDYRKKRGQYFTPQKVSELMLSQLDGLGQAPAITVLDPGAGTGILESTFCEHLISLGKKVRVSFDLYEHEIKLLPLLELNMRACKEVMASKGLTISYRIINKDFILSNAALLNSEDENEGARISRYDYIVCNPPFFKLRNSLSTERFLGLGVGVPNVYALFMGLSAKMLNNNGWMVFITPRTYCSGRYFRSFRKWFFNIVKPVKIHLFESRSAVFKKYDVLQETMILTAMKTTKAPDKVTISVSNGHNGQGDKLRTRETAYDRVLVGKGEELVMRIPTSSLQELVITYIDGFENSLSALGFKVSTGPVVPFRVSPSLLAEPGVSQECVPLIWMHNISKGTVIWPVEKGGKPIGIKTTENASKILLPNENYVLVKRFSSKEGRQRVSAGVFLRTSINSDYIGIENHVNYLCKNDDILSEDEAVGIMALLSSKLYNRYFQALNGSTQINATELNLLPFPSIGRVRQIGKLVKNPALDNNTERERLMIKVLREARRSASST